MCGKGFEILQCPVFQLFEVHRGIDHHFLWLLDLSPCLPLLHSHRHRNVSCKELSSHWLCTNLQPSIACSCSPVSYSTDAVTPLNLRDWQFCFNTLHQMDRALWCLFTSKWGFWLLRVVTVILYVIFCYLQAFPLASAGSISWVSAKSTALRVMVSSTGSPVVFSGNL